MMNAYREHPGIITAVRAAALLVVLVGMATVQAASAPQGPRLESIPPPRDVPYAGVITLAVDATDVEHAILNAHEVLPVASSGPLTLLYPQWLPGTHSPTGPIDKLAGLRISAAGQPLAWQRDPVDVYAFHVQVPPGVRALDIDLQFLSPASVREGRVLMVPGLLRVQWNTALLYPAGHHARQIRVEPSIKLPAGYSLATALDVASTREGSTTFRAVDLDTLVDAPLLAGPYFRRFELETGNAPRVSLDVFADRPEQLELSSKALAAQQSLVQQAVSLFGARHYSHYDFLLSLSARLGGIGLEHHQSTEISTDPRLFLDWDKLLASKEVLAHEFVHSWNGKFRRPADLWTPTFNVPMRNSLLWVYEGQTQYWGYVLSARSGMLSAPQALEALAQLAAIYDLRVGRSWRPLEDTTNDPIIAQRRPLSWLSWQRSEDYYREGQLVWLDIDTRIREMSGGLRSLDDFAQRFFGIGDGSFVPVTYNFDDVVKTLNAVQPFDWASFLRERLTGRASGAPLDGLARGGYRLVYTDTAGEYFRALETRSKATDLSFSLGIIISREGTLSEVLWDSPAFRAGLAEGTQLIAVDGESYSSDGLKEVIRLAQSKTTPIELLVKDKDQFRTVRIDYHQGLRYPKLERISETPALLDAILAPRK